MFDPVSRPARLTRNQKKYLLHLGLCQPKLAVYPRNNDMFKKGKQSSISSLWYKDFRYLEYNVKDKAFCFVCGICDQARFERERAELTWVDGNNQWSKMRGSRGKSKLGKLETHFSCTVHVAALRDFESFVHEDSHVDLLLSKEHRREIVEREIKNAKSKKVMTRLFDVSKTLARNGLAFRGNDYDENGNFRQIVYLLARHNSVMKSWLDCREFRKHKTTYLSPRSQTEYVSLLGEEVGKEISNRVKKASFCSVMADTTPDVSHSDELSVAVRFINADTSEPEERLVRIMETKDKTGLGSANEIIKCLNLSDIPLEEVMFQTYDSAASMCGKFNGAQGKINDLLGREIPYTKCTPRGVNIVVEHGCKASLLIGRVFAVLEIIFVIFTKSTKRNAFLREYTKDVENCLKLKNLSKTRWSARAKSVEAVWRSL